MSTPSNGNPDRPLPSPAALPAALPGAAAALSLLLAINLFNYIDRQVLAAVVPAIKHDLKATSAQAGLLQTAFIVTYMIIAPLFGWLGDRYRRWFLIGIGVVLWSFASGASGLAGHLGHALVDWIPGMGRSSRAGLSAGIGGMLITRMFVGVGEGAYGPTAPTVIADMYPVAKRGQNMAWFYAAIPVGSALGYELGSLILSLHLSWHWAFFVVLPPGLVLGALCFAMRDPPRGSAEIAAGEEVSLPRNSKLSDYWILLRTPSYVLNTAGMAAMTFALGGIGFWMPTYIVWHSHGAIKLAKANGVFGPIIVVSGLLGTLVGGAVGDWLRPRFSGSYFLVSGIAMIAGFPLFLLLLRPETTFPAAWVLIFFASFCLFFNTGPTNTILANVTHPSMRSAGFALNIFVIHILGDAISPPLIGWINDRFDGDMNAGFFAISVTILIGGICWLCATPFLARDTELAPSRLGNPRP